MFGGFTLDKAWLSLAAGGVVALASAPAQAADFLSAPLALVAIAGAGCDASPAPQPSWTSVALVPAGKASALLGGAPSELERIRREQEGGAPVLAAATVPDPQAALAPAAGPVQPTSCLRWLQPAPALAIAPAHPLHTPGEILGSQRLAVGRTMFDADWKRVERDTLSRASYRRILGAVPSSREQALGTVNAWVNRNIRYVEDSELFGRADYWAGATRTLQLRAGDCEDIALTKMQLLAAAGVPRDEMMLTIARDLVRGADHAVLIVKLDDRYVMLDDSTDALLDAAEANDYRPVLSFSASHAWLHGYQTASAR